MTPDRSTPNPSNVDAGSSSNLPRPISIRPRLAEKGPLRPLGVLGNLRASLRASEVYVCVLLDQIELASATDSGPLDRMPTTALKDLTAISDTLHDGVQRMLHHLNRDVARNARAAASLAAGQDQSG